MRIMLYDDIILPKTDDTRWWDMTMLIVLPFTLLSHIYLGFIGGAIVGENNAKIHKSTDPILLSQFIDIVTFFNYFDTTADDFP